MQSVRAGDGNGRAQHHSNTDEEMKTVSEEGEVHRSATRWLCVPREAGRDSDEAHLAASYQK